MEINKVDGATVVYSHTLDDRQPFRDGSLPFEYDSVETPSRGHAQSAPLILEPIP